MPWSRRLPGYERKKRLIAAVAAVGLMGGALVLVLWAVRISRRTAGWAETTGSVIARYADGEYDWDSRVWFEDSDGIAYTFRSDHAGRVSSEVSVRYPPRDPDRAQTPADIDNDRDLRTLLGVLGALLAAGGTWAAVWSAGLIGASPKMFEPDDWPTRTLASVLHPDNPARRPWNHEEQVSDRDRWAREQARSVQAELSRVPSDSGELGRVWRGRCRACGLPGAMETVYFWRYGYETRRCIFCLRWRQYQRDRSYRPVPPAWRDT